MNSHTNCSPWGCVFSDRFCVCVMNSHVHVCGGIDSCVLYMHVDARVQFWLSFLRSCPPHFLRACSSLDKQARPRSSERLGTQKIVNGLC